MRQSENGVELEVMGAPLPLKKVFIGSQEYCFAGEHTLVEGKINLVRA